MTGTRVTVVYISNYDQKIFASAYKVIIVGYIFLFFYK